MRCRMLIFLLSVGFLAVAGCTSGDSPTAAGGAHQSRLASSVLSSGACCFYDGTCLEMAALDCEIGGGSYQGDGSACDPNPCPQPPPPPAQGACCFRDRSCSLMTEADCAAALGAYQGDASCDPSPCPESPLPPAAQGACCFTNGSCALVIEADCTTAAGSYQGDTTTCDPNPCVQPPPLPPQKPEGCALGYWKNHPMAWPPTGHTPGDPLGSMFDFPTELASHATDTFMDALRYPGGKGAKGMATLLLRDAIVAVLNASHPDVRFPLTESEIVDLVNSALATMDRRTIQNARHVLDQHNTQGCPLH